MMKRKSCDIDEPFEKVLKKQCCNRPQVVSMCLMDNKKVQGSMKLMAERSLRISDTIKSSIQKICRICEVTNEDGAIFPYDCYFCNKNVCSSCLLICSGCAQAHCSFCAVRTYSSRDDAICLSCYR